MSIGLRCKFSGKSQKHLTKCHNESLLEELAPGDLVRFRRKLFYHWAVYIGDGKVIHTTVLESGMLNNLRNRATFSFVVGGSQDKAKVCISDFWDAAMDSWADKHNDRDKKRRPFPAAEIVKRAKQRLGPTLYHLLYRNCEHFATWCRYGYEESGRSDMLKNLVVATALYGVTLVVLWNYLTQKITETYQAYVPYLVESTCILFTFLVDVLQFVDI